MSTLPDLSSRPYQLTVEHTLTLAADIVFRALTEQIDRWFAEPGTLLMKAEVDVPFFLKRGSRGSGILITADSCGSFPKSWSI